MSESTRRDAMRTYGIEPARITTVLEGVSEVAAPDAPVRAAARKKYGLPEVFFYYPAMLAPHKNHALLLEALCEARKKAGRALRLVLSGARTKAYPAFEREVRGRGLEDAVIHLGYLPREDVLPVMANACALAFPSRFEGFGLPVLEAMQCNVPAIVSDATSLPDVAGDAAIVLPPDDPNSWADAMLKVLGEGVRQDLIRRGRANLQRFSWDRCAAETSEVLAKAAAR